MEYLLGFPAKITREYIILETPSGMGVRVWTHPMDEYSGDQRYKVYIHSSEKIENNTIVKKIYGFRREEDCILFGLLLEIKGIGPKTSMEIVSNSSMKIAKHILEENLMALMALPGLYKHAKEIMDYFRKAKNRAILRRFQPPGSEDRRAARMKEIMDIAEDMELDLEKTKELLEKMEDLEDEDPGVIIGRVLEDLRDGD